MAPVDGPGGGAAIGSGGPGPTDRPRAPKLAVEVRRARYGEVGVLVHLYRNRSESSIRTYHPFPFDPIRLRLIFTWMTFIQHRVRWAVRRMPRRAAVLLVVLAPGNPRPIGYGTVRFVVEPDHSLSGKFGYLVEDAYQGRGVGSQLVYEMLRTAKELGIERAGGTVLADNPASVRLISKFGWTLAPGSEDTHAPGAANLAATGRIDHLLRTPRGGKPGDPDPVASSGAAAR